MVPQKRRQPPINTTFPSQKLRRSVTSPSFHTRSDDSTTGSERSSSIKHGKTSNVVAVACLTSSPVSNDTASEKAKVHFRLPDEIPDSQESLDQIDDLDDLDAESFHTEDTVIIEGGFQPTTRYRHGRVSSGPFM